jgi:protoheme ferro-lyase
VEVLYDIDIVYQKLARSLDVRLERIQMVHTEPGMIAGLAELIRKTAEEKNWL